MLVGVGSGGVASRSGADCASDVCSSTVVVVVADESDVVDAGEMTDAMLVMDDGDIVLRDDWISSGSSLLPFLKRFHFDSFYHANAHFIDDASPSMGTILLQVLLGFDLVLVP